MKKNFASIPIIVALLAFSNISFGQAPSLGDAAEFAIFSTNGAVTNSGISQITGDVGTNNGSSTGFGNVNGTMYDMDTASAKCAADLLKAYKALNSATPTFSPASPIGNGDTLVAGVYSLSAATVLKLNLFLNAKGNPNAVFIFQIKGAFSTDASSKVILLNGALACNVFWKVEGQVIMASGTTMRGTVIANNAAIQMGTGDTLEGRALSTAGAVSVDGVLIYTPIGCGSPTLTGPPAPTLGGAACYGLFSSTGAVSNSGTTYVTGDIGSNSSSATGFNPANVKGTIHAKPDGSTAQCASDLLTVYNYLNTLPTDIELLYPAQFGNNLVLTPHTYIMKAAATLTDTLYLNAEGNANAVFVIKITGALTTSTYAKVRLINGAVADNVYWLIQGAVSINNYSIFNGTIVCNNGAFGAINTGVVLNGRALTTTGALTTTAITLVAGMIPGDCLLLDVQSIGAGYVKGTVTVYPNPFNRSITITVNDMSKIKNTQIKIYDVLGQEVMASPVTNQSTTLETNNLVSGIYFYKVISNEIVIQSGKLISQK